MTRVLALDVGSSSVRAQVYDELGDEVRGATAAIELDHARLPGELDAETLVEASRAVVERAQADTGFDAAAISCFWHSLVAVDSQLRPLTPVLTWQDGRSIQQAEALDRELHGDVVHARTGCPLHPSFWPAKLRWLADESPDVFARAAWFVSFPDLLFHRLTGELGTSLSVASSTGLLDLGRRKWDPELLDAAGIEPERLAPFLDESVAHGGWFPPVGDGACSNVGAGCVTRDRAALMVGTSGAFRVVHKGPREFRPGLFCYLVDERRLVEGGSVSDGGNLAAWLGRTLQLDSLTPDEAAPDAHGLTFLPLLGGERSPGWNGRARGALRGLSFATTPEEILQAALEGVAYRLAEIVDLLPGVDEIVATGGALRDQPRWTQILADVLGRPLVASRVREASARGAAVLVLECLGATPSPAPLGGVVEPRQERTEIYRAARERQRRLYETLA